MTIFLVLGAAAPTSDSNEISKLQSRVEALETKMEEISSSKSNHKKKSSSLFHIIQCGGWSHFNGSCYQASFLRNVGADLISIHSKEEQRFVHELVVEKSHNCWIGLRRNRLAMEPMDKSFNSLDTTRWFSA
ncbi:unnamed protein product, partial [Mesorhabditis belari]|uniref:C-type lectin domain-containing protein n=1 Tax=Mesorhabditis belari TaxID=2138241 RepID=A0AAF3EZ31_9BILA